MTNQPDPKRNVIVRYLLGLILLMSVQSCTSLNTLYYWADSYLAWEIDNYFDLTEKQKKLVDQRLDQILFDYKYQEIPRYVAFLEEIKFRSQKRLSKEDLAWFWATLEEFNTSIAHLLADDAAVFLTGLQDKQISYFETQLAEDNENWQDEHKQRLALSEVKRLERRYEAIEEWLGALTMEQKQQVAASFRSEQVSYQLRFDRRLKSQQRFLTIVRQGHSSAELRELLVGWYLNKDTLSTVEQREREKERELRASALVLMLDRTATEKQRQFFHRKLNGYLEQLEKILAD